MTASPQLFPDPVLAVVRERGAEVVAIAARGALAPWLENRLEQPEPCDTTTVYLPVDGDLAVAVRSADHVTVRVSGDARVLALQTDGRAVWIESGRRSRFPADQVERLVLLTGIYPDQIARGELVSWLGAGATHESLRSLWGQWLDSVVTVYGVDHQRSDVAQTFEEPNEADDLFDFLESHAALDDRATPAVVRRVHVPAAAVVSQPVEVGPAVFMAPAVTTITHTGPPFRPVLLVNTADNPYPDRVTTEDEPTPIPLPRRLGPGPTEVERPMSPSRLAKLTTPVGVAPPSPPRPQVLPVAVAPALDVPVRPFQRYLAAGLFGVLVLTILFVLLR